MNEQAWPVLMDLSSVWPCDCPDHAHHTLVLQDPEEYAAFITWLQRDTEEELS